MTRSQQSCRDLGKEYLKQEERHAQMYEGRNEPGDYAPPAFSPQKDKDLLNA